MKEKKHTFLSKFHLTVSTFWTPELVRGISLNKLRHPGKCNRFFGTYLTLIIILTLFAKTSFALQKLEDLSRGLPKGVKVYKYRSDDKRAILYVAEMDRREFPEVQFQTGVARGRVLGRETVGGIVRRATRNGKKVIVAANASFGVLDGSYEGAIKNLQIQNGRVISPPGRYACFGVTKSGEFLMERAKMNMSISVAGKEIPVKGLNQERKSNDWVVLYTPDFGRSTQTSSSYEVVISDLALPLEPKYQSRFVVKDVRKSGNTRIPRDGFVLSARIGTDDAKFLSSLKVGDQGVLALSFLPEKWNDVVEGIGGNSRLVKNGELCKIAHKGNNWTRDDPRTALGFNKEKLFLMVVDGRQGHSRGMSYRDVAAAMIELGATEAINLDGGSSSTFIVKGKLINRPSSGKERHVLNAVLITL